MTKPNQEFKSYLHSKDTSPLFLVGDSLAILGDFPEDSIDFCMTSPPYWGQREYQNGGIGLEADYKMYVKDLCAIFGEVKRVLTNTGSFWLNIGDTYLNKHLVGIPWRVAFQLMDDQ